MYGNPKNIRHNTRLFFTGAMMFTPSLTLISIATVIPFFLERLGASTIQIGMAAALALICMLVTQPFFGSLASRKVLLHKTFGKILMLQRVIFLFFLLSIPLLSENSALLIWLFLVFWGIFSLFVGSYGVFYPLILLRLLPPEKRGFARGLGSAIGNFLGMGAAALIPVILYRFSHPYDFVLIFSAGLFFLFIDATIFFLMRDSGSPKSNTPMSVIAYIKEMPATLRENKAFRYLVVTCALLIVANSLLPYYTLYAMRIFQASESTIAAFAFIAVVSNAVGFVVFGKIVDRRGPIITVAVAACLVLSAGVLALATNSLNLLFVAWAIANLGNTAYAISMSLLIGEVNAADKLPLYAGVLNTISLAFSAAIVMGLAPILENVGFTILFVIVAICGGVSFLFNRFILKKHLGTAGNYKDKLLLHHIILRIIQ